jgi:CheY-like chemotaxis protein/anti-sigma regulatory factor (Ser/Thr protein kinase)
LRLSPEKDINQAIAEVDEMIGQSIDVARSLTGELSPPMLHEGGLVPALLWLVRWMKEKHRLAVELVAPERVTTETEDTRVLLFQAVRELLLNVVKHAKTHSAHVEVQRAEDQLQVTVWDEGIGFDPAQLKAGRGGNSGFGLFSIRERIELSGGTIKIDSAVGSGSRFTLCAPIERTAPATDPGANEVKIRVLLVDDHVTVRQGLAHLLESETDIMVIGEASDGRSSLELVQTLRPHVVIMDVKMPGMNGIEATRLIKSEFPETEIIGLSMFEDDEHADAMRNAGASVYLSKIGPSEKLFAAIRACGLKVAAGHALLEKKAVQ